jgi:hypothetical protein
MNHNTLSIHDVERVEIDQPHDLTNARVRSLVITDKYGNRVTIKLFAEDMQKLKVHAEY